jgi:3-dehydroquinate synthase class II
VLKAEGEYTVVQFSLPETTTAKIGDELKLQRSPLTQVVRLPGAALTDGNKVFVMRDSKAAAATVTVADRDGESVLVQGLQTGDKVITSRIAELREGVAVTLEGAAPASR